MARAGARNIPLCVRRGRSRRGHSFGAFSSPLLPGRDGDYVLRVRGKRENIALSVCNAPWGDFGGASVTPWARLAQVSRGSCGCR